MNFFNNKSQKVLMHFGGATDCCLRVIVAGILEIILNNPVQYKLLATQILLYYSEYFAKPLVKCLTSSDKIKFLLQNNSCFIHELAYSLQQKVIVEILQSPEKYRSVLITQNLDNGSQQLSIKNSYHAIVYTLINILNTKEHPGIGIVVYVIADNKNIPMHVHYGMDHEVNIIKIQYHLNTKLYKVAIADPLLFDSVDVKQSIKINHIISDIPDIMSKILSLDQKMILQYKYHVKQLIAMVMNNIIDKDRLLSIYIDNMKDKNTNCNILTHGAQDFFNNLIQVDNADLDAIEGIIQELIKAVAREMTLGTINCDEIYAMRSTNCVPI